MTLPTRASARNTEEVVWAGAATKIRNGHSERSVLDWIAGMMPHRSPTDHRVMYEFAADSVAAGQALQGKLAGKLEARDYDGGYLPGDRMEYGMLEGDDEAATIRPRRATVAGDVYITVDIWIPDAMVPGGGYHEYRTVVRRMNRGDTDVDFFNSIMDLLAQWSRDYSMELGSMNWTIDFIVEPTPHIFGRGG